MKKFLDFVNHRKTTLIIIFIIAFLIFSNFFLYRFTIDAIFLTLAVIALLFKKEKEFLKDWVPPILLFYLYEYTRGRADTVAMFLGRPVILTPLLEIERHVFFFLHDIPSVVLQYAFSTPLAEVFQPRWYDYAVFLVNTSFFWFWLVAGFVIWRKSRKIFKQYLYGLVGFSLIDNLIYSFFPSAPPWHMSKIGEIPPIRRTILSYDYFISNYASIINTYGQNDFAAFPSHHAAWPFFAWLFLVKAFGKKAIPVLIVPIAVAFSTWYGGEHYVIDSLLGWAISLVTFYIMTKHWDALDALVNSKLEGIGNSIKALVASKKSTKAEVV